MITVKGLCYNYPDGTPALKGIDLSIPDGEFLLLCGPNGSGKTTLIRHLNGLLRPSSGTVSVDGYDTVKFPKEALQRVGMLFQDADSQIVGETIWEDVAFGPENLGCSPEEVACRVKKALQMVGLEHLRDKPCHLLSGGEKRRVAIAGVLAMQPRVLVFDEPFANLDYLGTCQVLKQIIGLHLRGHTVIVASHDVEKVINHVDRVVVVHSGTLAAKGCPSEIVPQLSNYNIRPPCYSILGGTAISWLTD